VAFFIAYKPLLRVGPLTPWTFLFGLTATSAASNAGEGGAVWAKAALTKRAAKLMRVKGDIAYLLGCLLTFR
jgi:hypothetical protein